MKTLNKLLNTNKGKGAYYGFFAAIFLLLLFGSFYVIQNENKRFTERTNRQIQGISRYATGFLIENFDLYYANPTLKYRVIVEDFLKENSQIKYFQIFNTEGDILYDSNNTESKSENVGNDLLEASQKNDPTYIQEKGRIKQVVSPYFEEWGSHKYSVIFYPSYMELDKDIFQYNLEATIFILLLIFTIISAGIIYILKEQYKIHKIEKEKLEILNMQRHEFMNLAAHNLRTPLTAIRGYISLMKDTKMDSRQKGLFEPIEKSSDALSKLIEDILILTDVLQKENSKIIYSKVNLDGLINEIVKEKEGQIQEKGLKITQTTGINQKYLTTSKKYLETILSEIIENAIKFNQENGKITINTENQAGTDKILITITDTGIGISEKEKEKMFTLFHQGASGNLLIQNYEGVGLGLYLSKILAEKLGGKIWLQSSEGKGTSVYITLRDKKGI